MLAFEMVTREMWRQVNKSQEALITTASKDLDCLAGTGVVSSRDGDARETGVFENDPSDSGSGDIMGNSTGTACWIWRTAVTRLTNRDPGGVMMCASTVCSVCRLQPYVLDNRTICR